jgi:hypothetical protein
MQINTGDAPPWEYRFSSPEVASKIAQELKDALASDTEAAVLVRRHSNLATMQNFLNTFFNE